MMRRTVMGFLRVAALTAPFVVLGARALSLPAAARGAPAAARASIRVAPGRAVFTMAPSGAWTSFGLHGRPTLVRAGGVVVFATDAAGDSREIADAARGGMKSLLPPGGLDVVSEGVPGGARFPSLRPDDDGDGRVDEDVLDGVDNDRDGRVDEDFAAIGDEMAVALFGAGDPPISIRQETYAWSLANIDAMVASTITVRNAGTRTRTGVRAGISLTPGEGLDAGRVLARTTAVTAGHLVGARVVIDGRDAALALLIFTPGAGAPGTEWRVLDDGARVIALSPFAVDLAPGAAVTMHAALVALGTDGTRSARTVHAAQRTLIGNGVVHMLPPPVSMTVRGDDAGFEQTAPVTDGTPGLDAFWLTPGRLDERLLGGSPNPFHDAITIDYEVPTETADEDGVEHTLSSAAVPTSVKVYNVTGRLVATLVESTHAPGRYRTGWTAQTDEGDAVASGVYYVKLQIGKRSVTKRLVQLK
jgi:hypothetical protein